MIKKYPVKRMLLAAIIGSCALNVAVADQQAARHSHEVQTQNLSARLRHREQVVLEYLRANQLVHQRAESVSAKAAVARHDALHGKPHSDLIVAAAAHRTAVLNAENQQSSLSAATEASNNASFDLHSRAVAQSTQDHWNQVQSSNRLIQQRNALQQQQLADANVNPEEMGNTPPPADGSDRYLPPLPEGISEVEPMDNAPVPEVPMRQPEALYPERGTAPEGERDFYVAPAPSAVSTMEPGAGADTDGLLDNFDTERAKPLHAHKAPLRKKHFDPYGGGEYPVAPLR